MSEQRLIDANDFDNRVRVAGGFAEEELSDDFKDGVLAVLEMLKRQPTIEERKKGKWEEKHHAYADEEKVIEEWQSCRCPVCGRYDTRPYMYYFDEPHFCSWCGADMRGEQG